MPLPVCRAAVLCAALLAAGAAHAAPLPLDTLKLPPGFRIAVWAEGLPNARSLAQSPGGAVFVSTRGRDVVYAVRDEDGDGTAEKQWIVARGLDTPNGVAFHNGALYIAEHKRLLRLDGIEARLDNPPPPAVVYEGWPDKPGHHWKYMAIGPDQKLYVNIGAPGNIVNMEAEEPRYATIERIGLDGANPETVARGVRNSVGFAWHPVTGQLWFTDNGRDLLGDDRPPCELNAVTAPGQHFGYPYCHGGDLPDPEFGAQKPCAEFVPPVQKLGPHVAPLGLKFYTGSQFPAEYQHAILIAEHGSWNRSIPIGYRISMVRLDAQGRSKGYEIFAEGWLQRTKAWGRPVDLLVLPDGALLVSDDQAGVLYRIAYQP